MPPMPIVKLNLKTPFFLFLLMSSSVFGLQSTVPPYGPALGADGKVINKNIFEFSSKEGRKLLRSSTHNNDFFELAPYFQPQQNPVYCGVASGVIVSNALRLKSRKVSAQPLPYSLEKPQAMGGGTIPFYEYVQGTFLADESGVKEKAVIEARKPIKDKDGKEVFDPGMALSEFADILRAKGLQVTVKYAGDVTLKQFKEDLTKAVDDSDSYFVANFKGDEIGLLTGGHISPLVAVANLRKTQAVLVLDVAGHKNPWNWVLIEDMYKAMNTKDSSSGKTRGYVIISDLKS